MESAGAPNALLEIVGGDHEPSDRIGIRQFPPRSVGVMRPGPNKRSRGRNNGNNPHHSRPRLPQRIQTFDSNGPNVKIRGNAYQVFERYVALAREAAASGDRIAAENLYPHAEHSLRVMTASGEGQTHGQPRPMTPADTDGAEGENERS